MQVARGSRLSTGNETKGQVNRGGLVLHYSVEPIHKFSSDYTRDDYIRGVDYLRPAVGGFVVGWAYMTLIAFLMSVFEPARFGFMMSIGGVSAFMSAWLYAISITCSTALLHGLWRSRLEKFGSAAFIREISVEVPSKQAMELCLAASAQIKNQKVIGFNEQRGELRVMVPRRSIMHDNTALDVRLEEAIDGVTHISLSSYRLQSKARRLLMIAIWGEKWEPILLSSVDRRHHDQMMDLFADNLRALPALGCSHTPLESRREG